MRDLRSAGYDVVIRSAGSHGPVDIVAISHEKKQIRLIQSKPKNMSQNAKERLKQANIILNQPFLVSYEVL